MELDPKDYDVVKLLTILKNNNGRYPPDLLTSRRQNYLRRVAEIGLGFGVSAGLKTTIKSGGQAGGIHTMSGLIEAVLVVAITAEAGTAAYIYRNQISALIHSQTTHPKVVELTLAPETEFSPKHPRQLPTDPPEWSIIPPMVETSSGTPSPGEAANTLNQGDQANSTPDPNGNNGNHFGQTPKPERTQDPGNNNNNNNNDHGNGK